MQQHKATSSTKNRNRGYDFILTSFLISKSILLNIIRSRHSNYIRIQKYVSNKNTDTNGLSYQGILYLEGSDEKNKTKTKNDILLLKPSFFGIGIDLNALWRRWKN